MRNTGRTARFNRDGQATAFITLDCKIVDELKDILTAAKQVRIPDTFLLKVEQSR